MPVRTRIIPMSEAKEAIQSLLSKYGTNEEMVNAVKFCHAAMSTTDEQECREHCLYVLGNSAFLEAGGRVSRTKNIIRGFAHYRPGQEGEEEKICAEEGK